MSLQDIKPGDLVTIHKAFSDMTKTAPVTKVTETSVFVDGRTFNRSSGCIRGARYASTFIRKA